MNQRLILTTLELCPTLRRVSWSNPVLNFDYQSGDLRIAERTRILQKPECPNSPLPGISSPGSPRLRVKRYSWYGFFTRRRGAAEESLTKLELYPTIKLELCPTQRRVSWSNPVQNVYYQSGDLRIAERTRILQKPECSNSALRFFSALSEAPRETVFLVRIFTRRYGAAEESLTKLELYLTTKLELYPTGGNQIAEGW